MWSWFVVHPEAGDYDVGVGLEEELIVASLCGVCDHAETDRWVLTRLEIGEGLVESVVFQTNSVDVLRPPTVDSRQMRSGGCLLVHLELGSACEGG